MSPISPILLGRSLLVTGGTGSFGSAVVRRALASNVGEGGAQLSFVDADRLFDPKAVYRK